MGYNNPLVLCLMGPWLTGIDHIDALRVRPSSDALRWTYQGREQLGRFTGSSKFALSFAQLW